MRGIPIWGWEWTKKNNGVQISNTTCGCGFRFDYSKLTGIKFGLKMARSVLMCDNLKYVEKVLRVEIVVCGYLTREFCRFWKWEQLRLASSRYRKFPVNYLRLKIDLRTSIRIYEQPFTIKAAMPSSPTHFGGCRRVKMTT